MEIRKVPISLLNAAAYNPRKDLQPGDPEYQKIARSIEKYGCVEPIICLALLDTPFFYFFTRNADRR